MNTKLITKALNSLFQLTDEDRSIVLKLWNLSDAEREQLVEALGPRKPATKKTSKKRGKSQRAAALSEQVKGSLQRREPTVGGFADDVDYAGKCSKCEYASDHNIHHLNTHPDYHEFTSAQSAIAGRR